MSAVLINTAGGITGGDEFSVDATSLAGSRLTLTTQTAERAYRAQPDETGNVTVKLCVKPKAQIAWLPQETLLFDRSSLRRQLDADVAKDGSLLVVEPIVFGRIAMGEVISQASFEDRWCVRRNETLVFADMVRMEGAIQQQLQRSAIADHARAMATVLLVAPNAEAHLPGLQALLGEKCGASLIRPGVLLARLLAPDSFLLRQTLIPVIRLLNQNEMPKTWVL
ncbi:MAG: urease accessory protein UreD [Marinosulfonomonas sp.]|nr:urease accessory protein UreD [Marinosulfonomonas sp.]